MKHILLSILILATITVSHAAPKVINFWHFNNLAGPYHNPGIPAIKANYSTIDTNKAVVAYKLVAGTSSTYAGYMDNVAGTDTNTRLGITAATGNLGYRMRNPSDSAYLQIYIPTKGYKNILLSYVLESSSTTSGQLTQNFNYSTDSGTTWKTSGLNINTLDVSQAKYQGSNWGLVSINFAADTAGTNNNNKLVFRIKFAGNTSGTSGNNRFDNIVVEGDSIIAGGSGVSVANVGSENTFVLYPNPVKELLNINCLAGAKMIAVTDVSGKVLSQFNTTDAVVHINTSGLAVGRYFVNISKEGEPNQKLSFIKE